MGHGALGIEASQAPSMSSRATVAVIAVIALYVLLYVVPLGVRPLSSPDEVRYGAIAREMLVSGDWVSPTFNGVRYFEKPAGGYWLNALALAAFGEGELALRLPAALATGLTALIVFVLARRFLSRASATLAVAIFLTTSLVGVTGTLAVLDPLLSLCTTAALAAWYLAVNEASQRKRLKYLACCGIACGGAFLVKGFIGWAVPALVAAGYLVAERRCRSLATLPWVPIAAAVLVSAPWALLIHVRQPDFWNYFFWVEHVKRFTAENAQHARPSWFYLACLPVIAWPWILAWPTALRGLAGDIRRYDFIRYLVVWVVLPFIFFSISRGKLLTYVLPCFPAVSLLVAAGVERRLCAGHERALRGATVALALVFVAALAVLVAAQLRAFGEPFYDNSELVPLIAISVSLTVGLVSSVWAARRAQRNARPAAIAVAGVALLLPLQVALPNRFLESATPVVAVSRYTPSRDTVLVSDAETFGTVAWAFKRDDVYVVSQGEIEYGLSYPEARFRYLTGNMLRDLIAANRNERDVLIVCETETESMISAQLPPGIVRDVHGKTVFLALAVAK
jgi:4-amino-4-deoxy-L-arabinose transferase